MEIKCEYCGTMMDDKAPVCPNCGGTNANMKRVAEHTPKTIAELKDWYVARHLPPYETTRFFIGENYKQPKAFGIYEENGRFIVYKNKADGSRAVRYEGTDEAYAVNEIYLKLKSEILNQKAGNLAGNHHGAGTGRDRILKGVSETGQGCCMMGLFSYVGLCGVFALATKFLLSAVVLILPLVLAYFLYDYLKKNRKAEGLCSFLSRNGTIVVVVYAVIAVTGLALYISEKTTPRYYEYDNTVYCWYDDDYYYYDDGNNDYYPISFDALPAAFSSNPVDYEYDMDGITWDAGYTFEDSNYYQTEIDPPTSSSSASDSWSSDSSYDWDSGSSWDSGGSDWGSDW